MKTLLQLVISIAFVVFIRSVFAEIPPPADDLSTAYAAALDELGSGKDRQSIADHLQLVVEKHMKSPYASLAQPFLQDLISSAKRAPVGKDEPPENRLAETRMPFHLLKFEGNWGDPLKDFMTKQAPDPACELAAADRSVIARLIPLLADRSPIRSQTFIQLDWSQAQPRVCDLALALIEYHSKASFHESSSSGNFFHQLSEAEHEKVAERVALWWGEVKDKSVAAGVRAQLLHGRSYPETVMMALSLAKLTEGQKTDDREVALNVLRKMVTENSRNHVGVHAADALAELGDNSSMDVFYNEWKSWLGRPGLIHDSHIAFYLCQHGGRREWQLLHTISLAEIKEGKGPGAGAVWACVVNSGEADTNPNAIPILGLAISQTENTGSRSVQTGSQSFSYADTACEQLQKQTKMDFRYDRNGTASERLAAIRKAQAWWDSEGNKKYNYDFIEKYMDNAAKREGSAEDVRLKRKATT